MLGNRAVQLRTDLEAMESKQFAKIVEEVLDPLPSELPNRIRNVAVLVEGFISLATVAQIREEQDPPPRSVSRRAHNQEERL